MSCLNRLERAKLISALYHKSIDEGVAMGNYALHIEGTGAHHGGLTADADHILKETVARLKSHGHNVHHASITYGSREVHAGAELEAKAPTTVTPSSPPPVDPGKPVIEDHDGIEDLDSTPGKSDDETEG